MYANFCTRITGAGPVRVKLVQLRAITTHPIGRSREQQPMPQSTASVTCGQCPYWRCIHGNVGQCRLQDPHFQAESVFSYPMTQSCQSCLHGDPSTVTAGA